MEHVLHQQSVQTKEAQVVEIAQLGKQTTMKSRRIAKKIITHLYYYRFGVCCLFITSTSGSTLSQNCSYIQGRIIHYLHITGYHTI